MNIKKRASLIIIAICVSLVFFGCNAQMQRAKLYDTDVYGVYECEIHTDPTGISSATSSVSDDLFAEYKLTLNEDMTYTYSMREKDHHNGEKIQYEGNIVSIDEINRDITRIKLDNENEYMGSLASIDNDDLYKYKNLIGEYIPATIKKNSDFTIADCHFSKDGIMTDIVSNSSFKYKIKSNIIWVEFVSDYGYQPHYFIVDGGVFRDSLYKTVLSN